MDDIMGFTVIPSVRSDIQLSILFPSNDTHISPSLPSSSTAVQTLDRKRTIRPSSFATDQPDTVSLKKLRTRNLLPLDPSPGETQEPCSSLDSPKPSLPTTLVSKFLQIQNITKAAIHEAIITNTFKPLVEEFLGRQTTYPLARKLEKVRPKGLDGRLSKINLQSIFMEAAVHLAITRGSPKAFLHTTSEGTKLSLIGYQTLEGRTSLYSWSGYSNSANIPGEIFIDQGTFSLAQRVKELSTNEINVLKSLRTDKPNFSNNYYHHVHGVSAEIEILQHIEFRHGTIPGIISAPKVILPPQQPPTMNKLLGAAHIQESYDGNLTALNFTCMSQQQQLSVLNEFRKIIEAVRLLNTEFDLDGSNVNHGDIKPQNILFKTNPNGFFEFYLSDFGCSFKHEDLVNAWFVRSDEPSWRPSIYTEGFCSPGDKEKLIQLSKDRNETELIKLIKAMEVYALGITLAFILRDFLALSDTELATLSTAKGFYPDFYRDLILLCTDMCLPDTSQRRKFKDAEDTLLSLIG